MTKGQLASGGRARPRLRRRARRRASRATRITLAAARGAASSVALVCAIGACSLGFGPGVAAATGTAPKPSASASQSQIISAESQVAALASQISQQQTALAQADERYNQSVVNLTATQASLQTTTASIAAVRAQLASERSHLRNDAVQAYIGDTSSSAAAALFSAPTSASQVRRLYETIGAANLAADVAKITASQRQLGETQSKLIAEQQAQTTLVAQEGQTRQSAAAVSAQSEATLAQVKGSLAEQVAAQAATQAAAAARAAAAATSPAVAQAAASQASQASQVASTVGSGSAAAASAAAAANQAAGLAASSSGSPGGAPVTISGGTAPQPAGVAAVHAAMGYLGVPYVFGGMSSQGLDCSGLTALAWGQAGVALPHSAADQYAVSRHVSMAALEPGDLIFYDLGGSGIDHVVMYVGPTLDGQATAYGSDTVIEAAHTGTLVKYAAYWSAGLIGAARP